MEQCSHCDFTTKYKNNLTRHEQSLHLITTVYECEISSCKFKTKYEESLDNHYNTTKHKNNENDTFYEYIEDTKMYKCKDCEHQTKHKRDLERHSWMHKSPDELTWYECQQCEYSSIYKDSLKKHNLVHRNPEEIKYVYCYHCDFKSKDTSYLAMHIKSHNSDNLHKCQEPGCNYRTVFKKILKKHLLLHELPPDLFSCELCAFTTRYEKSIKQHMVNHKKKTVVQTFKCHYCDIESHNKTKLVRHMISCEKNLHVEDTTDIISKYDIEDDTFKCRLCDYKNKSNQAVKNHYLKHKDPDELEIFSCLECDYKTIHKDRIYTHQKLVHKRPENWLQCAHCEFKTKYKTSLVIHVKIHQNSEKVKYYYCDQCKYKSFQQSNLRTHKKVHRFREEVAEFKCNLCPYGSSSQKAMNTHKSMHETGCFFSCFLCNLKSFNRDGIREHNNRFHTDEDGDPIFKCPFCFYSNKDKTNVENHLLIHKSAGETDIYKCLISECNFETKHKSYLKQHYYTLHEDEKNVNIFKCAKCDYQSRLKKYLYKHVKNMHTDPSKMTWYKCNVCPFQATHKQTIKQHMLRRHSTNKNVLQCPYCKYKTLVKEYIVKHVKRKHGKIYEQNTNCQNRDNDNEENTEVIDEYEDKSKFNNSFYERDSYFCFLCNFTTNYRNGMIEHNSQFHTDSNGQPLYKCPHCLFSKRRKDAIKIHMLVHPKNEADIYKCLNSDCKFETKYKSRVKQHYYLVHDGNAKILKCSKCSHTTKSKEGLNKHVKTCHTDPSKLCWYQCHLCPTFRTKTKGLLKSHITNLHASKVFKCSDCKYKTLSQEFIIRHISAKHDTQTYKTKAKIHAKKNTANELSNESNIQIQDRDNIKIELDQNINFNMHDSIKLEDVEYGIESIQGLKEIVEDDVNLEAGVENVVNFKESIYCKFSDEEYNEMQEVGEVSAMDCENNETNTRICSLCSFKCENFQELKNHILNQHLL